MAVEMSMMFRDTPGVVYSNFSIIIINWEMRTRAYKVTFDRIENRG